MPSTAKNSIVINSKYLDNGVSVSPAIPTTGEKVKVVYDGLLSKSGASHVYARIGFGSRWENAFDYQMTRSNTGFEVSIPVTRTATMNICFKDCANNWDNNSGKNYSFDVTQ